MTERTIISLGDEDGALIFKADGSCEIKFGAKAKQIAAPGHLVLMVGLHGMLGLEEFRDEVIEYVDGVVEEECEKRSEKVWRN